MATISSAGIGSGLDVNSIVSQLVALEKQPLKILALKATSVQSQISAFGSVKSQFSTLTDVATRLSVSTAWGARNATSSNTSAATITTTATANATHFTLDVDALAMSQSVSSGQLEAGKAVGAGTLTLSLGTWASGGSSFAKSTTSSDVAVQVSATDTVATIAAKINASNSGVVATAFNDGTHDRLLLSSKDTGKEAGFRVVASDTSGAVMTGNTGLARLGFDPATSMLGMAAGGENGVVIPVQYGQDAKARINGLVVTSASNTLADNIPGVTIKLLATTTSGYGTMNSEGVSTEVKVPVTMSISENVIPAVQNVQDFVDAYNALNTTLSDLTKYDSATKTAGLFQGDSSVVGLQTLLRNMLGSVSTGGEYSRLSDVGLELQLDGSLKLNTPKLSAAANNGLGLQQLFSANSDNAATNGFGLKFAALGRGLLGTGGSVVTRATALETALTTNGVQQAKVNDRASVVEEQLRKRYSALDVQMASLNAMSAYVTQQVATWNKSTA